MAERISIDIAYTPEQRENGWAFYIHNFGFRAYADTEEEGQQAVSTAINTLLEALRNDRNRLTKYLDALEVQYRIQRVDSGVRSLILDEVLGAPAI